MTSLLVFLSKSAGHDEYRLALPVHPVEDGPPAVDSRHLVRQRLLLRQVRRLVDIDIEQLFTIPILHRKRTKIARNIMGNALKWRD